MNWTVLTQDKDKLQALVNKDINLQIPKMQRISQLVAKLLAFQEGLFHIVSYLIG